MRLIDDRDLLALNDLRQCDVMAIVERAQDMARHWSEHSMPQSLMGKRIALVVNDGGWRNTTAFDLGISAMGGICVHTPLRLEHTEATADLAAYLDNWVDAIVSRAPELSTLRALADAATAPVVNARTRQNHPCETLGDLSFYYHRHGSIDEIKVAVVAPDANILGSWLEAAAVLPLHVVQVYPRPWHVPGRQTTHTRFRASTELDELFDAHLVITDCWPEAADAGEMQPYRITASVLDNLAPYAEFLPCPPVTRGQEVSADAMLHPACRVVAAKAFLLHAQNAALEWIFKRL
jgi:ornithine carbamoyltransferase